MTLKVVTWGTGNVGQFAVRAVVNHPELELVGHIVTTPERVGKDVAALANLDEPTGIIASSDIDKVLGLKPDCVVYTAHSETRMMEAAEDQARCLSQGINVVASSLFMLQQPDSPDVQFLAEPIQAACLKGGTTCFNNGVDPGFANDTMPLVFTGVSEYWTSVRMQEIINYATYEQEHTIREVMGFGYPIDHKIMFFEPGVLSMAWGGSVRSVGAALGVEIEKVYEVFERVPLDADTENAMGVFKKGTMGAVRFEVRGVVGGRDAIVLEHVTRLTDDMCPDWPKGKGYKAIIEGEPNMTISMDMEDRNGDHAVAGVIQTATCLVNAIPAVVGHKPGMVAAWDLPKICGKGLYRPELA
ncbi:MAG: diacylglycerol kinase [Gammaproteobacteria bacterium]|nr:diacylglycerol kinase [Gammaproteobacteria bacterium]MBT8150466.1 diacylglycerol kinase [Gammaproteobacteria bacterium]NND39912.1 diacylglycerol kinase [Pseudomonadales bacterium]NNL10458.1 diacylglycerol kinase [Pseudomonadales bacterium]NNM12452.1 diacylglycerol kinase [Pseudomonadales bacterium]